ncbi:MAG: hypothetical protein KF729_09125 [Sandaracinaceae bacterium]|nr:hypothetical protein [Sandaracinaceae bacterium]
MRAPAVAVGLFALGSLFAVPAAAQVRVWSDGPSPEEGAPSPVGPTRFLDLTAFAQPGFIVRGDDDFAGRTDDTFWLQRARFGFTAQLFEWLRMRMEVEFAPVTLLQDAFLDVVPHPAIQLRVGQFLVPFLRAYSFNELNLGFLDRPVYVPISPDRSFIRYLSPRDVGAMVHGLIGDPTPRGTDPVLAYQAGAFIGRGANIAQNDNGMFLLAVRLELHVLGVPEGRDAESDLARNDNARVAVATSAYSNCDDRGNWNRGFAIDSELRYAGLYASAGFVWFRNSVGGAFFAEPSACRGNFDPTGAPLDFVSRGAHLQVQYVLDRAIFPIDGMDLEVLARIDWVDANSPYDDGNPIFGGGSDTPGYIAPANFTDSDNPPTRWRLTFGVNWFLTGDQQLRLGINYQHNREDELVVTSDGFVRDINNDIFWIQLTAGL